MAATLTDTRLKSALTNEQIVAARTRGTSAADASDPVQEEIAAACAKVDTFASGYTVPAGMLTAWAADLAAHNVAKRLGTPTADQVRTYERANKELEDLRDGKFKNIPKVDGSSGKVISGGRAKVL